MKTYSKFLVCAGMAVSGLLFGGCQNDVDAPAMVEPDAAMKANTTIAELKAAMWQDDTNYAIRCPYKDEATKTPYIIKGRVISSDAAGNVYKSLYIQDNTGALTFSINQSDMTAFYHVGQELVINVTGFYIGKYAGLEQVGWISEYNGSSQVGFMSFELFQSQMELNGYPNPAMSFVKYGEAYPESGLYTIRTDIPTLNGIASNGVKAREMMSQLVELSNVHFDGVGSPWVQGYIVGSVKAGVREVSGDGDVIWGADAEMDNTVVIGPDADCTDISKCLVLALPAGSDLRAKVNLIENKDMYRQPIMVRGEFEKQLGTWGLKVNRGAATEFWVEGMEKPADDLTFANNDETVSRSLMDEKGNSIIVRTSGYSDFWNTPLPTGTGKVTGLLSYFNGSWQIVLRSAADCQFEKQGPASNPYTVEGVIEIESGIVVPGDSESEKPKLPAAAGDGTVANPYNIAFVHTSTADLNGVWVEGYVAGYVKEGNYTVETGEYSATDDGSSNFANESNIIISQFAPPQSGFKNSVPAQLATASRPTLGLKQNPSIFGKKVKVKCNIKAYLGVRGIRNITEVVVE